MIHGDVVTRHGLLAKPRSTAWLGLALCTTLLGTAGGALAAQGDAKALQFQVERIPALPGLPRVEAVGIDAAGTIAATSRSDQGQQRAFLFTDGRDAELGAPGPMADGSTMSTAVAISANGAVLGSASGFNGMASPAIWANGNWKPIGNLVVNGAQGQFLPNGINDHLQVTGIGRFRNAQGAVVDHAVIWHDGEAQDLGTLAGTWSAGVAINNAGQVVGVSGYPNSQTLGDSFIYTDRQMQYLGTLGGATSTAQAISANGHYATGRAALAGDRRRHAFIYDIWKMDDMGHLSPTEMATGLGVNDNGEAVGWYSVAADVHRAFVYQDDSLRDLNALIPPPDRALYTLTEAVGVNDNGQIVANGYANADPSTAVAFLLSPANRPTPERSIFNRIAAEVKAQTTPR